MGTSQSILNNYPSYTYMNGFLYQYTLGSNSKITVYPGSCRDGNNVMDIISNDNITCDISKNGRNGLDVGAPILSNTYGLCVIADSSGTNPVASIAYDQSSSFEPYLPSGYDSYRLIGYFYVNNLKKIQPFNVIFGNSCDRKINFSSPVLVVSSDEITSEPIDFSLSNFIPSTNFVNAVDLSYQLCDFLLNFTPNEVNNIAYVNNFLFPGPVANHVIEDVLELAIYYKTYNASDAGITCYKTQLEDILNVSLYGYKFFV